MMVLALMLMCAIVAIATPDIAAVLGWVQLGLVIAGAVLSVLARRARRSAVPGAAEASADRKTGVVGGARGGGDEQAFSESSASTARPRSKTPERPGRRPIR